MNVSICGVEVNVLICVLLVAIAASEALSWRKSFARYRERVGKAKKVAHGVGSQTHNAQKNEGANAASNSNVAPAKKGESIKKDAAPRAKLSMLEVARPISFLISVLSYVDVALLTLFAQDMLAGTPHAENTLLLALPLTVVYLAYLISGPLRAFCVKRMGLRGAFIFGCVGISAGFLVTAACIFANNFALFVAAVFLMKCFLYLIISCGRLMPTLAPTEHARTDINIETDNADVSASALMGVLAGYLAQYLGNVSVYFFGLFPVLVLLIFICKFVPKGVEGEKCEESHTTAKRSQPSAKKPISRFIFHPSMVSLFFFALITLGFSACYRSYLFPLFASEAGLNKADISNLIVVCSVVVFYAAPPLTRLSHRLGSRNLLTWVLGVCAAAFLGFLVAPSSVWAVAALLLVILIKKVGEPCTRTLWPRVADAQGVSRHSAQAAYEVLDGIICFAKMPITGALLALGHVCVCAIFGVYSALSALLFALSTARGPLQGKEGAQDEK